MQIDESDEQDENASVSIHERAQPVSKITVEREAQPEKHFSLSDATEKGI
jgi:hypothetical protein